MGDEPDVDSAAAALSIQLRVQTRVYQVCIALRGEGEEQEHGLNFRRQKKLSERGCAGDFNFEFS